MKHATTLYSHRRTSRGLGDAASLSWAKPIFFGKTLNFSGRSQQPEMEKKIIKRKNGIHSVEQVPEILDFYYLLLDKVSRAK